MSDPVSLALAALKADFQTINPTPEPVPAGVYAWPADRATITYDTYPFIIVARSPYRSSTFNSAGSAIWYHNWIAEIRICLVAGPVSKIDAAGLAETKTLPWIGAAAKLLLLDQGLGGNALNIGRDDQMFSYRDGNIGWDTRTFWGIRFEIPVRQTFYII